MSPLAPVPTTGRAQAPAPGGDKSAPLCWGQRYVWLRYHQMPVELRSESHILRRVDLPAGVGLASIRATLSYLVRRHESLRTTYHCDLDGDPFQRVHPPAPLPVTTVSVERDGTATPAEVVGALEATAFDLAREWPVRACVITAGGTPRQLVLVLNHIAFDAWSLDRFDREMVVLQTAVLSRRPAQLPPVRSQPLDLARAETATASAAFRERARAFWREELQGVPTDVFAARRTDVERVGHAATLTSPSLLPASRAIADRHRVWPFLVHLATYASLTAAFTGSERVAPLAFQARRADDAHADVLTCAFSPSLLALDCSDDPTFGTLVERARACSERVAEHAGLPYDDLLELLVREGERRGEPVRTGSELSFLSHASESSRASRTTFTWTASPAWAAYGSDTLLRVYELRNAVVLGVNAVAPVMAATDVEAFLRGYEAVLLAQAEPGADLTVSDVARLVRFSPPPTDRCVPAQGSGPEPAPDALDALCAAVRRAGALDELDPARSCVGAGGRVLRVPRVLSLLAEQGWSGLTVADLTGSAPLRELAGRLTPTA